MLDYMKIISIDPGYDRVGVAIIETDPTSPNKDSVLFSDCITTKRTADFYERLKQIQTELSSILNKYSPEHLVMEELYFANNSPTALRVSEARGIISGEALRYNIPVHEIHPNHVKIAITGHGAAKKADMLFMLPKLIHFKPTTNLDDEIDAIAIGVAFIAHKKFNNLTK